MLASAFISDLMSIRMCTEMTVLVSVSTATTEEKVVSMKTVTLQLLQFTLICVDYETFNRPWLFASM